LVLPSAVNMSLREANDSERRSTFPFDGKNFIEKLSPFEWRLLLPPASSATADRTTIVCLAHSSLC
jgi:hypothetical protein